MQKAIERFLTAKEAENSSPHTIRGYRADLEELAVFIGRDQGPEQLTRTVIRGFLARLKRRDVSNTTMTRKLAAVKSFTRWLAAEGILPDDVFEGIHGLEGPRLPKTLPDIPSQEEIAILLDGPFPTAFPERDRLILELIYGAGMRVSEVSNISLDDIRLEQNCIVVHGKGQKDRLAPFNPRSRAAFDAYLPARRRLARKYKLKTRALFFAVRNRYAEQDREAISVRTVGRILNEMTEARGLQKMHPHLLRHSCATHMLDNGAPLDVIAQLLGHANLDTTAHYAQVSTRLMLQAYNAAHPHAAER